MATENSIASHVSHGMPPQLDVDPPEESLPTESLSLETSPVQETSVQNNSEGTQDDGEAVPIPATDPLPRTYPQHTARPPSFHRYSQEPRPPPGNPAEPLPSPLLSPVSHGDSSPSGPSPQPRVPPLSLGALSNFHPQHANGPMFSSADEPPPYSPTHTILPHYFSLEPIPVRSYIIKDSTSLPFMFDFWLCSTTHSNPFHQQAAASLSASMSAMPAADATTTTTTTTPGSRPHSPTLQLQERGLVPQQHQNELKYCIIRPTHTDRTAIPLNGSTGPNAYFLPALALVAANYPSRWIWWGTEALQLVVFGRNLKNIVMEWRWKHGRTRIGGPIVHRLVGCSFHVTPERRYCWKQGTGRKRPAANANANATENRRRANRSPGRDVTGSPGLVSNGGGSWVGTFFSRARVLAGPPVSDATDIPLDRVLATPALDEHDTPVDRQEQTTPDDDDDYDEELGCYHCREESPSGVTGRIVAVYRPGRPANRSRDRPATSRKLEIYTELGDRCETAMMLMCTRLEDLFMSVPEQKKGRFIAHSRQDRTLTDSGPNAGLVDGEGGEIGDEQVRGESREDGHGAEQATERSQSLQSSSLKQRIVGSKAAWKSRVKWIVAVVLIAVVAVLVFKPKMSH